MMSCALGCNRNHGASVHDSRWLPDVFQFRKWFSSHFPPFGEPCDLSRRRLWRAGWIDIVLASDRPRRPWQPGTAEFRNPFIEVSPSSARVARA